MNKLVKASKGADKNPDCHKTLKGVFFSVFLRKKSIALEGIHQTYLYILGKAIEKGELE